MIPDDVLQAIGRSPPTLLNEERPFLVTTESKSAMSPTFRAAVAAALRDGTARTRPNSTPDSCDPASEGRCFDDAGPRIRADGRPSRPHQVLVGWEAEEHLITLAGMKRRSIDLGALVDADDTPVPDRRAIQRIARLSSEIAARTLEADRLDLVALEALYQLLAAFGAACCTSREGQSIVVTAPSPWGPATIERYTFDDDRMSERVEIDPVLEAMLPVAMSTSVVIDPNDDDEDIVRINAHAVMIEHADLPTAMEAARTLAAGWPA